VVVDVMLAGTGGIGLAVRHWNPEGTGVPVLAVHGLASNARLWDGTAAALAELGHPVAAVDLRGHGRSAKPDDGYDFGTVTADLVALQQALGWRPGSDRHPLVVGQSWGANVVLELAVRHPDAARSIALVDGGTIELSSHFPRWEDAEAALAPPVLEGMAAADFEAAVRRMHPDWPESGIAGTLANVEVRAEGTIRPWLTRARHLTILRHLWEHRPSEHYALVQVPVVLVPAGQGGDADADKRASIARAETALARVCTQWFVPADHDIHAQFPDALADLLDEAAGA